jgi:hypothetical protein
MAPDLAFSALRARHERPLVVLDPMSGSGTTLVAARSNGHIAIGFDLDPLSVLLSSTSSRDFSSDALLAAAGLCLEKASGTYGGGARCPSFPDQADEETKEFILYWFDSPARRQLAALSRAVLDVKRTEIRDLLWVAFSRLIVTKDAGASLARDVSHSRPHRHYLACPAPPIPAFMSAVKRVACLSPFADNQQHYPRARAKFGDARNIPLPSSSVDMVLTSPPYLNAIDYMRAHRLSLVWMGWSVAELREVRATMIGAESKADVVPAHERPPSLESAVSSYVDLSPRNKAIVTRYLLDMRRTMAEIARVLKPNGRVVVVLGDCRRNGVPVHGGRLVAGVASQCHLRLRATKRRQILRSRRYLPPPMPTGANGSITNRIGHETVLEFSKESR